MQAAAAIGRQRRFRLLAIGLDTGQYRGGIGRQAEEALDHSHGRSGPGPWHAGKSLLARIPELDLARRGPYARSAAAFERQR